jgi:hypothetical protein
MRSATHMHIGLKNVFESRREGVYTHTHTRTYTHSLSSCRACVQTQSSRGASVAFKYYTFTHTYTPCEEEPAGVVETHTPHIHIHEHTYIHTHLSKRHLQVVVRNDLDKLFSQAFYVHTHGNPTYNLHVHASWCGSTRAWLHTRTHTWSWVHVSLWYGACKHVCM